MTSLSFSLDAPRGENFRLCAQAEIPLTGITGVHGPSGSGKTSLLSALAGLLSARGYVSVGSDTWLDESTSIASHQRSVSLVFQDSRLFPHLDTRGNLEFAWRRRRKAGPGPDQVAEWFGLADLLDRKPDQLSRGQQQRVALARGLVSAPELLLLDEPLSNIDVAGRQVILPRLRQLQQEQGFAMLYVSHDMAELSQLADWLLVMENGKLTANGPLIELSTDLGLSLAHEERAAAVLEARVSQHDSKYNLTELELEGQTLIVSALDREPGTPMRLQVPARDISLCLLRPEQTSILNVLEVRVDAIEAAAGSQVLLRLQVGGQFLLARVTRKSVDALNLRVGDAVYAQVKSVALLSDTHGGADA